MRQDRTGKKKEERKKKKNLSSVRTAIKVGGQMGRKITVERMKVGGKQFHRGEGRRDEKVLRC